MMENVKKRQGISAVMSELTVTVKGRRLRRGRLKNEKVKVKGERGEGQIS
jgi:hypothetical protein